MRKNGTEEKLITFQYQITTRAVYTVKTYIAQAFQTSMYRSTLHSMFSSIYLRSVVCILVALCSYQHCSAQDPLALQIRTIDVAPYGFESANGSQGIYFDLAQSLAKRLTSQDEININHQIYPYARIIHELQSGQTDLTIMFKYKELESYVTYLIPLPSLDNVVIGLSGIKYDKISDLEGKKVAYLRGAKFSDAIDNNEKIIKITTHDFRQGIDMLFAERADFIIGPIDPIISAIQRLKIDSRLLGEPLIVSTRTPWLQISNASKLRHSKQKVKNYFNDILANGKLNTLRSKYLPLLNETNVGVNIRANKKTNKD